MKILLINPIVRISSPPSYFPLGLAYIAAVLHKEGYTLEIFDLNAYRYSPEIAEKKLKYSECDLMAMTGFITEYNQIKWIVEKFKDYHPDTPVILGGGLATAVPDYILKNTLIDTVVIGEGEVTMIELVKTIVDSMDLSKVEGIAFKSSNEIIKTNSRHFEKNLDEIPFPSYENFPTNIYSKSEKLGFSFPAKTINIITSRGCPYGCIYCYHGISGYKYRSRTEDNIILEMIYLKEKYNIDGIVFSDDTFILDRERVFRLCEKIKQQKIDLKWSCNGRVDLVDKELLMVMKSAGCVSISYGIESGCPEILKIMRKGFTVEEAENAVLITKEVGLRTNSYFMIGMIGETRETIKETVEFCKKIKNQTLFSFATPFSGTKMYKIAEEKNLLPKTETMLEKWNIWNNNLLVNMSELSDMELLDLKKTAEEEINKHVENKVNELYQFFKEFGVGLCFKRIVYFILRKMRIKMDNLSKSFKDIKCQEKEWQHILEAD